MTSAAALAAPHVARAKGRKLRLGHMNSGVSALQRAGLLFGAYVAEKTEGRYQVDVYPNGQLGSDLQLVKAVSDGALDMTIAATPILGTFEREAELVELPYLFRDLAVARAAMDGDLGGHLAALMAKHGLTVIGWGENGLRHMTANKPVRTVADLSGLKLRVQPVKIHVESFNGLGAVAAPLPFTELPEALRTGRFEAQENSLSIFTSNDFLVKLQSHLSLTGHVYSSFAVLFSSDVLEEMAPADRAVIASAGPLAAKATRDFNDDAVANGLPKLLAAGMTVVTDVNVAGFQRAMEGLIPRLGAMFGAESVARVRGLIA